MSVKIPQVLRIVPLPETLRIFAVRQNDCARVGKAMFALEQSESGFALQQAEKQNADSPIKRNEKTMETQKPANELDSAVRAESDSVVSVIPRRGWLLEMSL
jgi:hypothetical protein